MKMETRLLALTAVAAIIVMGTFGVVFVVSAQEDGGAPAGGDARSGAMPSSSALRRHSALMSPG